jgi:hypothetical protein
MSRSQQPKPSGQKRRPLPDQSAACDEAPATQEDDGGESVLEGRSREKRDLDWDALEEPPKRLPESGNE